MNQSSVLIVQEGLKYRPTLCLTSMLGWGVGGQGHAPVKGTPHPLYRRLDGPGPVWTYAEDFFSTGFRCQDRLARRQQVY
jgi:hypothetical protein